MSNISMAASSRQYPHEQNYRDPMSESLPYRSSDGRGLSKGPSQIKHHSEVIVVVAVVVLTTVQPMVAVDFPIASLVVPQVIEIVVIMEHLVVVVIIDTMVVMMVVSQIILMGRVMLLLHL